MLSRSGIIPQKHILHYQLNYWPPALSRISLQRQGNLSSRKTTNPLYVALRYHCAHCLSLTAQDSRPKIHLRSFLFWGQSSRAKLEAPPRGNLDGLLLPRLELHPEESHGLRQRATERTRQLRLPLLCLQTRCCGVWDVPHKIKMQQKQRSTREFQSVLFACFMRTRPREPLGIFGERKGNGFTRAPQRRREHHDAHEHCDYDVLVAALSTTSAVTEFVPNPHAHSYECTLRRHRQGSAHVRPAHSQQIQAPHLQPRHHITQSVSQFCTRQTRNGHNIGVFLLTYADAGSIPHPYAHSCEYIRRRRHQGSAHAQPCQDPGLAPPKVIDFFHRSSPARYKQPPTLLVFCLAYANTEPLHVAHM